MERNATDDDLVQRGDLIYRAGGQGGGGDSFQGSEMRFQGRGEKRALFRNQILSMCHYFY